MTGPPSSDPGASDRVAHPDIRLGLALVAGAAVMWGTAGVSGKALYGLAEINALSIGLLRLALSVPFLFAAAWLTLGGRVFRVAWRHFALMALFGVAMAFYQACYFAAIRHVGVAIGTLVSLCVAPMVVAVLSARIFGDALNLRVGAAIAAAVVGVAVLVGLSGSPAIVPGHAVTGVVLASGAAVSYALVAIVGRVLAPHYSSLHTATVGFAVGALVLLPFAATTGLALDYPPAAWAMLGFIGLVPTALAYVLFFRGMRHAPAMRASIATMLEPLMAAVLAWAIFGESLGVLGLVGAALLLGAVFVLYREVELHS